MKDRRYIEETFPIKEISQESVKEKRLRDSHISTLHVWWARRPLLASRATVFSSLIHTPENDKDLKKKRDFIVKLSKWENSANQSIFGIARKEILDANGGKIPKILDPFAGGGSIPLESLRLGCETYASDYNPVSTLILKCILEYPQKFTVIDKKDEFGLKFDGRKNRLISDVDKWGKWILEESEKELKEFYPSSKKDEIVVGYIWSRTIPCQNPSCGAKIPLFSQYRLVQKANRNISLYPYIDKKQVKFKIVGDGYEKTPPKFEPDNGTISRGTAVCLVCGFVSDENTTRKLFVDGKSDHELICIVSYDKGKSGKNFRIATKKDLQIFEKTKTYLQEKRTRIIKEVGIDPVPDEPTPDGRGSGAERSFGLRNYGLNRWGDLFNTRQQLALVIFSEKVKLSYHEMLQRGYDNEYAKAITSYLALGVDRLANYNSTLCRLNSTGGRGVANTFGRHTLRIVPNYIESNPFNPAGAGWVTSYKTIASFLEYLASIESNVAVVSQSSCTSLKYPNDYFDAIFTDPPYYDNIAYSYLSDFFYVWLKRMLGDLYPDLFATPLTPKSDEIVVYSNIEGGFDAGKKFFEDSLKKSFKEISRVLKKDGIALIVYAHKSTSGWETLINSLLDSGLVVTGAWPIHTEMKDRLRARESAALASSIYMITRKIVKTPMGFYREMKDELRSHLSLKLDRLWNEEISGADFFIAAIGSAIEVFGKYEKIIDDEGNCISTDRLLDDVRRVVTNYAVKQVLHNGFAEEISELTRFYVLWRWSYRDGKIPFDDAHKLAQSVGIDLTREWNKGFIQKDKEFVKVLGPDERKIQQLEDSELIDVLHKVLLLWKESKKDQVVKFLQSTPFGKTDVFYRVAQAISECLPNESKEKKLLDGFLSGKDRILKELVTKSGQRRLNE